MPIAFYMDLHVPRTITVGLRLRGVGYLPSMKTRRVNLNMLNF